MSSEGYSTSQWIASVPPSKVWQVTSKGAAELNLSVELLAPLAAQKLASKGASFADEATIATEGLAGLERALNLLQQVLSLQATVGALAKSVHILEASEPGYDVSYSDPLIPFSVFLGSLQKTEKIVR